MPVDSLGYWLMPNHFHLLVRPHGDGDLGRWMQWLLTTHARTHARTPFSSPLRHHGPRLAGAIQAFPVQDDGHLVTVLRYVKRNALGAELVAHAEDWK
ncbi:hypothetical protein V5E97_02395 [Singulisphaera sp. Ch08]|uniref:Transposase IS200-like domain-containing protein n=1 Tax=Singulisphaera sp. Ch08 TaxID=3120278 RepID=A0AAU7CHZ7_9BACT